MKYLFVNKVTKIILFGIILCTLVFICLLAFVWYFNDKKAYSVIDKITDWMEEMKIDIFPLIDD